MSGSWFYPQRPPPHAVLANPPPSPRRGRRPSAPPRGSPPPRPAAFAAPRSAKRHRRCSKGASTDPLAPGLRSLRFLFLLNLRCFGGIPHFGASAFRPKRTNPKPKQHHGTPPPAPDLRPRATTCAATRALRRPLRPMPVSSSTCSPQIEKHGLCLGGASFRFDLRGTPKKLSCGLASLVWHMLA